MFAFLKSFSIYNIKKIRKLLILITIINIEVRSVIASGSKEENVVKTSMLEVNITRWHVIMSGLLTFYLNVRFEKDISLLTSAYQQFIRV